MNLNDGVKKPVFNPEDSIGETGQFSTQSDFSSPMGVEFVTSTSYNTMEELTNNPCSLEQELAEKASELEAQRTMRMEQLVDITLEAIAHRVVSREADIINLMTVNKGQCANGLREIVVKEILRSADGLLWCPHYNEKSKSNQQIMVFTGSHWETVDSDLWKDFVDDCSERCGVPEAHRMNSTFMNALYESVAFNLKKYRRRMVPIGEAWLNVSNGTLVFHRDGTAELREQRKEDLFTYVLPYPYDEKAECPMWHKFLDRVLPEPEAQRVLAEFVGYCIMPDHSLEKLLMMYGDGLNGKSVTLEVVEALLGSSNVSYLSLSEMTNDDVKRAGIEGKMLNISHESGKNVNANVMKQLTSGERVLIKHLYFDPRETNDYGKQMAAFNDLPRAENTFGFFRRLLILPYKVIIPKEEIDRQLASKLKTELPGILNWVLEALAGLMTRGDFTLSECCEKALEQYRLQSDSTLLFLKEMCEATTTTTMSGNELFTAYQDYCVSSSLKALGKIRFYNRVESHGFAPVSYANLKYYHIKVAEL